MKLYHFSVYAERRDAIRREEAARNAVLEIITHLDRPGSVIQLKRQVNTWFILHQDVMKQVANLR